VAGENPAKAITGFFIRYFNSSSTALKSSVLAVLLVVTSGLAACHGRRAWHGVAPDQKSNPNTCNITDEDSAGLEGDLSTNVHAVRDYASTIARMLKDEKFEALDCLADHARSSRQRLPGGAWKLHTLYPAWYNPVRFPVTHATEEDWDDLLQRLQRWVSAAPKSVTARIALASAYLSYAADTRGDGDAVIVSESGWKLIRERTAAANRILEKPSALRTKCPEWYVAMQEVAQNQGWNAARKRKLFEKAFMFDPGYYYHASVLASYMLPKHGGLEATRATSSIFRSRFPRLRSAVLTKIHICPGKESSAASRPPRSAMASPW
jgi:hypothetical protein